MVKRLPKQNAKTEYDHKACDEICIGNVYDSILSLKGPLCLQAKWFTNEKVSF